MNKNAHSFDAPRFHQENESYLAKTARTQAVFVKRSSEIDVCLCSLQQKHFALLLCTCA
jgi:hypothetical protein